MLDHDQFLLFFSEGFTYEQIEANLNLFRKVSEQVEDLDWLMADIMFVINGLENPRVEAIDLLYWLVFESEDFPDSPIVFMREQGFTKSRIAIMVAVDAWREEVRAEQRRNVVVPISVARGRRRLPR